jgi:hypothetical protein
MTRVEVLLDENEEQKFQRYAKRQGLSLSAWLREAGNALLTAQANGSMAANTLDLRAFFAACDAREKGREPDWEEHLAILERSKRGGLAGA